jgi:hypothetical protein
VFRFLEHASDLFTILFVPSKSVQRPAMRKKNLMILRLDRPVLF